MTGFEVTLRRLAEAGRKFEIPWALVGGIAVSVRTEPRFTRDIDLAVAVSSDREATGLLQPLDGLGYRVSALIMQERTGRLAAARLTGKGGEDPPVVDLLCASSGIEPEIVAAARDIAILPGVHLPVASAEHLLATKLLAFDESRVQEEPMRLRS